MHKHLQRQLRRLGLSETQPPSNADWKEFLAAVVAVYGDMDRERYLIEHSIEMASREMQELAAKIAEERDKFAGIFDEAPSGMASVSTNGVIVDVNEAMVQMFGFSRAELAGHHVSEFVDSLEVDGVQSRVRDLGSAQMIAHQQHHRIRTRSGEFLLADVRSRTVLDAGRRPKMILMVVEDVTERVRLELQLRHAQKLESVGRLAAGIAHEINTPIQFVGDNVSFLATSFEQLLAMTDTYRVLCERAATAPLSAEDVAWQRGEEEMADLDYIRQHGPASIASTIDGVNRVARIVQSMKAFAHPDRGERTGADINKALRDTLTVATNEIKYVADVETEYGDIPSVLCFLSDLNQVFLNLLVNAAHAIEDVVRKGGQRGTIRVRTFADQDDVVIAISDTGTGIPAAVQGRIFDPFFTTKGVGKGTGQGLALAHSVIVEQHGGTLTFETEMGKGTTFYVRIPVTPRLGDTADAGTDASPELRVPSDSAE